MWNPYLGEVLSYKQWWFGLLGKFLRSDSETEVYVCDIFSPATQTVQILFCRETLGSAKTNQSTCHVGTLQKNTHNTLTGTTVIHVTMERNKRNSIAGFPTRPERLNEDRDDIGGVGVCEMGMAPPLQVGF